MDFSHTIGHQKQKQMFERASAAGRLSHAYIFAGPEHIGKTAFALDLAAALGAHPVMDVAVFDSGEALTVEEARALQGRLALTPTGSWKVAIVGQADWMNAAASNCLLKVMEEPPAHSMIILIASNYYALLPTLASRAQRINFVPLSDREIAVALSDRGLTADKQENIVDFAAGRVGLAGTLATDEALYDFFVKARGYSQVLEKGGARERLISAQELAALPGEQIRAFLDLAMRRRAKTDVSSIKPKKLLEMWQDMQGNINLKLALDNLFL